MLMLKGTIGEDGRLFFPKPLLRSLNITGSTKVLITSDGDNIIVEKETSVCKLCHGRENLIEGFSVCRNCAEKISDLVNLN